MGMIKVIFNINEIDEKGTYVGDLIVLDRDNNPKTFSALSGPWGKGGLPEGRWQIATPYRMKDDGTVNAYKRDWEPWVCPLKPLFDTDREKILIHPDGNVPGTKGCIGVQGEDEACFNALREAYRSVDDFGIDGLNAYLLVIKRSGIKEKG